MLSKNRRITRKEFPKIISEAKRFNSPNLLLYLYKDSKDKESKFSFSVSKKVLKKAVDRNKFRRRGYSIVNILLNRTKKGFLCFFHFKKESRAVSFVSLEKEIEELLFNSGVIS